MLVAWVDQRCQQCFFLVFALSVQIHVKYPPLVKRDFQNPQIPPKFSARLRRDLTSFLLILSAAGENFGYNCVKIKDFALKLRQISAPQARNFGEIFCLKPSNTPLVNGQISRQGGGIRPELGLMTPGCGLACSD